MKIRIISAIVMALIFVPVLIIGGIWFTIFCTLLGVLGLYELINIRESKKKFPFVVKVFAYLLLIFYILYGNFNGTFTFNLDYRVMAFIMFCFLTPLIFINDSVKYNINDALFLIGSTLFVGLSFNLLLQVRAYDLMYIIYLLLITIITDTFALSFGRRIGKHKLCPKISPNKTVEGFVGGLIMGTFVPCVFYLEVINSNINLLLIIGITMVLSVVGQIGDLVFSHIKRYYDKKDFSNLIPGHGGILDRLDSIIFVLLAFILFLGII